MPPYFEYFADKLPHRWAKLARRVFGVTEEDDLKAARMLAPAVTAWLKDIDNYFTLADVGIGDDKFQTMAEDVMRMFGDPEKDRIQSIIPTSVADIVEIYRRAI